MYKISVTPEEIDQLPMTSFSGEIKVIDHIGPSFIRAIDYLRKQKVLGFDTESRPCFSPHQRHYGVSLLQLSGPDKVFLFRIKKLAFHSILFRLLSNEKILKIGAACTDDCRGLQRYGEFTPHGFVDLQRIVWEYGIRDKSVKKMAAIILGIRISKTQQLSNWEADTLSEAQQKYAATDAWVCREMYMKLLASEKHPLTLEQINPPQPQQEKKQNKVNSSDRLKDETEKPRRRRKPHKRRKKSAAQTTLNNDTNNTQERKG